MTRRIRNWPVMSAKCATCPFREDAHGDPELAARVLSRTLLKAQQICHHPQLLGERETHLCRGARDYLLHILYRMGLIEAETDQAFDEASERYLGKGKH